MNNESTNPACSPFVAASVSLMSPSHVTGSNVVSGSKPASTIVPLTTPLSHISIAFRMRLRASFDASLVERYSIENFQDEAFASSVNLNIALTSCNRNLSSSPPISDRFSIPVGSSSNV